MRKSFVFLDGCHGGVWGRRSHDWGRHLIHNAMLAEKKMNHGGKRSHAGRKKGSGRYGESTKALRVPMSRIDEVLRLLQSPRQETIPIPGASSSDDQYWRPLYQASTAAPTGTLTIEPPQLFNLNTHFLPHPEAVVFVRVPDMTMRGAGIHKGDILIVDQRLPLNCGQIIAAFIDEELIIRYLINRQEKQFLMAANPHYSPLILTKDTSFIPFGVVTAVVHQL